MTSKPWRLSEFIAQTAEGLASPGQLTGAIIFVALRRALDRTIEQALALSNYHRGAASPWSHVFVLGNYSGAKTPTFESTVRTKAGDLIWDEDHPDVLDILLDRNVMSGIYKGVVTDYDDSRVERWGIKWLPENTDADRARIVEAAADGKWREFKYAFPGLLRELIRLVTKNEVALPPTKKALFCSAFVQQVYIDALGERGRFVTDIRSEDTTPDDLWYPNRGVSAGPAEPPAAAAAAGRGEAERASAAMVSRGESAGLIAAARIAIERAVRLATDSPPAIGSRGGLDVDRTPMVQGLQNASEQLRQMEADPVSLEGFIDTENPYLALALSKIAEARSRELDGSESVRADLLGLGKYELADPGWWASAINRLTSRRIPFIEHTSLDDYRVELTASDISIAMAGDWGTGLSTSAAIAQQITALRPDVTIHLGDVYYSGLPHEVSSRFLLHWPPGLLAAFALNSNHEMYAGGAGYFGVTLQHPNFRHQKASYFCLALPGWQIIGLDSAYDSRDSLYQTGSLRASQLSWFAHQLKVGKNTGRRSVVMTHHNPLSARGALDETLLGQVCSAASGTGFSLWYWGHEHVGARFASFSRAGVEFLGRCVGHGGIPYSPESIGAKKNGVNVEWTETELANDAQEPRRGKNGFAVLKFSGSALTETFIDEFGKPKDVFRVP